MRSISVKPESNTVAEDHHLLGSFNAPHYSHLERYTSNLQVRFFAGSELPLDAEHLDIVAQHISEMDLLEGRVRSVCLGGRVFDIKRLPEEIVGGEYLDFFVRERNPQSVSSGGSTNDLLGD